MNSCAVDGFVKCERWIRDDQEQSEETKTAWWLNRLIGQKKEVNIDWPFPFVEGKLFFLLSALDWRGTMLMWTGDMSLRSITAP